jgi:hypothetical protein
MLIELPQFSMQGAGGPGFLPWRIDALGGARFLHRVALFGRLRGRAFALRPGKIADSPASGHYEGIV